MDNYREELLTEYKNLTDKITHQVCLSKQLRYLHLSKILFGLTEPEALSDIEERKRINKIKNIKSKNWKVPTAELPATDTLPSGISPSKV